MKIVCIFFTSFLLCGFTQKEECEVLRTFDQYLLLLQKWLSAMHEVAKWNWNDGLLEGDLVQEERTFGHLSYLAATNGINEPWATKVISAQIEAGNMVIAQDFELWQRQGMGEFEVWDLQSELQPYLCTLTNEMFFLLGQLFPHLQRWEKEKTLSQPPLSRRAYDQIPFPAWQKALSVFTNRSQE